MVLINKKQKILSVTIIIVSAILLILPQLLFKSMVIKSDSIFHFNRFYDTAMQIKTGNFQYFIHMYSFQQSGRIVNALYGPLMAYFQGLLVLISPSWFFYQILSNFVLYLVAGFSMFRYLVFSSKKMEVAICTSIIFMTTFSIQYWIVRQGFSSWGAAIMPLCLIPIIQFQKSNKFNSLQVGFLIALITQVHLVSAAIIVLIYFVYFLVMFFHKQSRKLELIFSVSCSVLFFLVLTSNIWYSLFTIYKDNNIIPPFVNKTMYLNTITANSYYWLINPLSLVLFIGLKGYYDFKFWKRYDSFDKIMSFLLWFFLLLSTNIVPWKFLSKNNILGVNIIQFPFRFFVPFTVLLLISISKIVNEDHYFFEKKYRYKLIAFFSIIQGICLISFTCLQWRSDIPITPTKHEFIYTTDFKKLKQSFFSKDKRDSLKIVQKSTPDYLPRSKNDIGNPYGKYKKYIIEMNPNFKKYVEGGSLVTVWEGEKSKKRNIPVILYKNTQVTYNGKNLETESLQLSSIGTPIIADHSGQNIFKISYNHSKSFIIMLCTTILTWGAYIVALVYKFFKR